MGEILITTILFIFSSLVCYCDLRYRKIYNYLTIPALIMGLSINTLTYGLNGFFMSLAGMIVGLVILLIPFILGWIGGGDVKLLIASGSLIGPELLLYSTLWGLILAGIPALIYLIIHKKMKSFLFHLFVILFDLKRINELSTLKASGRLPLGVFLSIGALLNWLYFIYH